jgi:hypothetical protein
MVTVEKSIQIHRPVEDVFAYMTRFEHDTEWRQEVRDIRRTQATNRGIGERYEQLLDLDGRQVMTDFEVTEFDLNRHVGFRGTSGDVSANATYDFEADGARTRVDIKATVEVSGAAELTEPYIKRKLETIGQQDFERLRRRLESRA